MPDASVRCLSAKMMGVARAALAACAFEFAPLGCGDANQTEISHVDSIETTVPSSQPRPTRYGLRFDPATLRRGARIGELVVDSISAQRAIDSTYVGTARFDGQIRLSGWTIRNPDPDLHRVAVCFEADSASSSRLPRWQGDERRAWFCFTNQSDAEQILGQASEGVPATIVIERFTIHRGLSDEVNSARLVRRLAEGVQ
jgi:hypothetical protein